MNNFYNQYPYALTANQQYPANQIGGMNNAYPNGTPPANNGQDFLRQMIMQELRSMGFNPPQPFNVQQFGADVLTVFGNNIGVANSEFFRDNIQRFVGFMQTEQGKEACTILFDEFKSSLQK